MAKTRITALLGIKYPIIQAGMVWVSGGKLAAAAANAGILGVIGAGSMTEELLSAHIKKAQELLTADGALAVNVPLLYRGSERQIEIALELGIRRFITSAGSPKMFTQKLKEQGCTVGHVVSSPLLAQKCQDAGVDFVVAEGFEAGGHNGRDEITTMVLIPQVKDQVKIPVVAAGGIGDGRGMAAAFALGAEGVQLGTRFVCSIEASAHPAFKEAAVAAEPGSTMLCMKKLVPVRLLKNKFFEDVAKLEAQGASAEDLDKLLGKYRAKNGMLLGDMTEGELEIGEISGLMKEVLPVKEIVKLLLTEYQKAVGQLPALG